MHRSVRVFLGLAGIAVAIFVIAYTSASRQLQHNQRVSSLYGVHAGPCGQKARAAFSEFIEALSKQDLSGSEHVCQCVIEPFRGVRLQAIQDNQNVVLARLVQPVHLKYRTGGMTANRPVVQLGLGGTRRGMESTVYVGVRPNIWHGPKPWPVVFTTVGISGDPLHISRSECGY